MNAFFLHRYHISTDEYARANFFSGTIITFLHSAPLRSSPSCGLGKFQPISGAPK